MAEPLAAKPFSAIELRTGLETRQFFLRPGTEDEQAFLQIFRQQHYDLSRLKRWQDLSAHLDQRMRAGGTPLIVDAGAHIGASVVYFAGAVPQAMIVAIEPEAGNFELLVKNSQGLNVACLNAGLSSEPGHLGIVEPDTGTMRYRTERREDRADGIPSVTIDQIYRERCVGAVFPFLVKIDIEGAERDVFAANTGWIERTPLIVVELHDWLYPKSGIARPFLKCVSALDRDFVHIGENVFSVANTL